MKRFVSPLIIVILGCAPAMAAELKPLTDPDKLFPLEPTVVDSQPAHGGTLGPPPLAPPTSMPVPVPISQTEAAEAFPIGITLVTKVDANIHMEPYIADLKRRFMWVTSRWQLDAKKPVTLSFKIHANGQLSELEVQGSSGNSEPDDNAMHAIEDAAPFRRLPLGTGDFIVVRVQLGSSLPGISLAPPSAVQESNNVTRHSDRFPQNKRDTAGQSRKLSRYLPLMGYIDIAGKVIIKPQFAWAQSFDHGYAEVADYGGDDFPDCMTTIFIDQTGKRIVEDARKVTRTPTHNGKDSALTEIVINGQTILRDNFTKIWSTRGGYKLVKRPYDFCVCDEALNVVRVFPDTWLQQGLNAVTGNYWCLSYGKAFEFTGAEGKSNMPGFEPVPLPRQFDKEYSYFDGFSEGLSAAMDENRHWSYVGADGKVAIPLPADCSNAQEFSEGLAAVSKGGTPWAPHQGGVAGISPNQGARFGYIDKTGRFVIPPKFPCPQYISQEEISFKGGVAKATGLLDGDISFGIINRKGDFIVAPIYKSISPYRNGLATIEVAPVGFNPLYWANPGKFGARRDVQCRKLLRQFNLIGMPRDQVEQLLGRGDLRNENKTCESYLLASSCTGSSYFDVLYKDDRVDRYTISSGFRNNLSWITDNAKPGLKESIFDFVRQHASVKGDQNF